MRSNGRASQGDERDGLNDPTWRGMVVVLHSEISMPLHPKAKEFAKSGLFAGVKWFADLEKRIAAIPPNKKSRLND